MVSLLADGNSHANNKPNNNLHSSIGNDHYGILGVKKRCSYDKCLMNQGPEQEELSNKLDKGLVNVKLAVLGGRLHGQLIVKDWFILASYRYHGQVFIFDFIYETFFILFICFIIIESNMIT